MDLVVMKMTRGSACEPWRGVVVGMTAPEGCRSISEFTDEYASCFTDAGIREAVDELGICLETYPHLEIMPDDTL